MVTSGALADHVYTGIPSLQRWSTYLSRPYVPPKPLLPKNPLHSFINLPPHFHHLEQFALTEASYTTIRLMQEFTEIEPRGPQEWKESITLTLAVHPGCLVGMVPPYA